MFYLRGMAANSPFPRVGILGGGQLGKMLCQAGADWHLPLHVLDQNHSFPAANYASVFVSGDFRNKQDVLEFGRKMDVVTIEIEHIDTEALHELEAAGVKVYPQPDKVDLIKDKGLQKQFYAEHGIATTDFELFDGADAVREAVAAGRWTLPFVQKARTGGYDGQYEQHLRAILDLPLGRTDLLRPGAMINLLGAEGHTGPAHYDGWEKLLAIPEVYPHLYGKAETRPFRKMGHVTALGDTVEQARTRARLAREAVRVISR
jgi:phosphoribosylaminoimidazole carboxylase (NCAIR synthetase)